jgi:hypothetical protein
MSNAITMGSIIMKKAISVAVTAAAVTAAIK